MMMAARVTMPAVTEANAHFPAAVRVERQVEMPHAGVVGGIPALPAVQHGVHARGVALEVYRLAGGVKAHPPRARYPRVPDPGNDP
jgi:hypothetical protein